MHKSSLNVFYEQNGLKSKKVGIKKLPDHWMFWHFCSNTYSLLWAFKNNISNYGTNYRHIGIRSRTRVGSFSKSKRTDFCSGYFFRLKWQYSLLCCFGALRYFLISICEAFFDVTLHIQLLNMGCDWTIHILAV